MFYLDKYSQVRYLILNSLEYLEALWISYYELGIFYLDEYGPVRYPILNSLGYLEALQILLSRVNQY